jgi:hypothetical protein
VKNIKEIYFPECKEALISFSKSGKWFGLIDKLEDTILIYDSSDIMKCFENIENKNYQHEIDFGHGRHDEEFEEARRLIFDRNDQYFLIQYDTKLVIYSIREDSVGTEIKHYYIDRNLYDKIWDVNFVSLESERGGEHVYKCMIACKANSLQSIKIFDINDPQDKPPRTLSYINKNGNLVVKISDNH